MKILRTAALAMSGFLACAVLPAEAMPVGTAGPAATAPGTDLQQVQYGYGYGRPYGFRRPYGYGYRRPFGYRRHGYGFRGRYGYGRPYGYGYRHRYRHAF